jgi:hypothetical protein
LLSADAISGDRALPVMSDHPIRKYLAEVRFYVPVLGWIDDDDSILIDEGWFAFDINRQAVVMMPGDIGAPITELST